MDKNKKSSARENLRRIPLFPFLLVWLELILHLAVLSSIRYAPIYILFAISFGFFTEALLSLFRGKALRIFSNILAVSYTFLYMAELIARNILQTYYPFSALRIASENKLFQFVDVVIITIARDFPLLLLMALPLPIVYIFRAKRKELSTRCGNKYIGKHMNRFARRDGKPASYEESLALLVAAVLFHFAGLGAVYLPPWSAEANPKQLYESDIDYNYQVEALGLYSFLRLDIKHMKSPADTGISDFSKIGTPGNEKQWEAKPPSGGEPGFGENFDKSPNVMDVDLSLLGESTNKADIEWLCDYFSSVTPSNKNRYTGMFEGYNVIFITVEALDGCAISEKYTPTLYNMRSGGFVFKNFYTPLHYTSTASGECQNLLGLYPKNGNPVTMTRVGELGTNCYFSLAQQLGRLGYKNRGYHNNWDLYGRSLSHSTVGYYWQYEYHGLKGELKADGSLQWPQKDTVMVEESMPDFIYSDEPFNVYYLTVSGHIPYGWNWATAAYKEELSGLEYTRQTTGYIASVLECDRAVKMLVDGLKESGKLENTLFVIVPDHIPYTAIETKEEICGKEFGASAAIRTINESAIDFEVYRNSLIIWSASMQRPVEIDKVCCQVDILPTISNLMGLEYDSRMLTGSDILSDSPGLVIFSSRSWRSDRGLYNRFNRSFTPARGIVMTEEEKAAYVERMNVLVRCKLDSTAKIIENDFYDYVFGADRERIKGEVAPRN